MRRSIFIFILITITMAIAAALVMSLIFIKNQPGSTRGVNPLVEVNVMEPDSAQWGLNFPNEYSTFLLTKTNQARTTYGGSMPYSKLEADPRLVTLFAGYSFSKDYNEERGHLNSLSDVHSTKRVNDKTPGTCFSCKSADNPRLWGEMGMAKFDNSSFSELGKHINNPIGCANCHEANTMRLIVTNPALDEALKAQGKDWQTFTRQEMRTVVCANCHVEYYFAGEGKYLTFPWKNGTKIENIATYYDDIGFKDWLHNITDAPMIKMQHPDYEMYTANSTHYTAGVACADCHMPYIREGAAKFSTHDVKSPLLNANVACGACHRDVDYVSARVAVIQSQVRETMNTTEDALIEAITAIKAASAQSNMNTTALEEARRLHREAQLRWDFINAENSMGFHNPEEALRILAASTDLARQAQLKAVQAAGNPALSGTAVVN
ncbi:MAG: ammonia-forming cytochrome c nitrite reductase subunit c552 [Candidatus Methanoperedens sp.]|nr:ammonia-forming cytochrome c nitrite reductase subunit c552 [Candidatus Methanoperedens sp.]CAG0967728.1 nitrite reductase (cytochrome c-552) [Methanosarcinales archaeon]